MKRGVFVYRYLMDLCLHWILLLKLRNVVDLCRPRSSGLKVLSFLLSLFVYIIGIHISMHLLLWKSQLLALKVCVNPGWVILTIGSFFGFFIDNNLKKRCEVFFVYFESCKFILITFWIWYHVNSRHPPEQMAHFPSLFEVFRTISGHFLSDVVFRSHVVCGVLTSFVL